MPPATERGLKTYFNNFFYNERWFLHGHKIICNSFGFYKISEFACFILCSSHWFDVHQLEKCDLCLRTNQNRL